MIFSVSLRAPSLSKPTPKPTSSSSIKPTSYFNYNTTIGSPYGPYAFAWGNVNTANNYWSEFGFTKNQCKSVMQSPIDVCTMPEKHCLEYHEPRAKVCTRIGITYVQWPNACILFMYCVRRTTPRYLLTHLFAFWFASFLLILN